MTAPEYTCRAPGHEVARDEPYTCLVTSKDGTTHRVRRWGRHCMCHGYHVSDIDPAERP